MNNYLLFSNPNFISGMARVLDLGSTLNEYNSLLSPEQADFVAISSDWLAVGSDIASSIAEFKRTEIDGKK